MNKIEILKIVHSLNRNCIPMILLESVLESIKPYISMIGICLIIDSLTLYHFKEAMVYAILMIVLICIDEICLSILHKQNLVFKNGAMDDLFFIEIRKKALNLDTVTMEDTTILEEIRKIEALSNYEGGLGRFLLFFQQTIQYSLSIIYAFVLIVLLCMAYHPIHEGWMDFIQKPIHSFLFLVLAFSLGMLFSHSISKQVQRKNDKIMKEHYVYEAQHTYWNQDVFTNMNFEKNFRINNMLHITNDNYVKNHEQQNVFYASMFDNMILQIKGNGIETLLFSVVAYGIVFLKTLAKSISIGSFFQYSQALVQFNLSCTKLIEVKNEWNRISNSYKDILQFFKLENKMHTGTLPVEKRLDNKYEIEFHDVSFKYPHTDTYVLKHIHCKISPYEKMAIVGENGAGKSTFIKLMIRLYEPTDGYITLNGIDIRKYDYEEYLQLFGVVFQKSSIFSFDVNENISFNEDCDETKIKKILKQVGLESIDYKQQLNEKYSLSGGQAQKLMIARSIYKDAHIVVLDEPTAALDPVSEQEIYKQFLNLVSSKTGIFISHRMSSCRICSRILVLDKGRIKETGTHDELVSNKGLYYQLWNAQAKYYQG